MITLTETPTNQQKMTQLRKALSNILAEALKQGFYGTAGVELSVQDGTIQHIRRHIEQIDR